MKRIFVKIILFISSYFPLYLFLLILNFEEYNNCEKIKNYNVKCFVLSMLVLIMLSLISLVLIEISKNSSKRLIIEKIERPDDTIISYIMTYIVPILSAGSINKYEIIVNVLLFALIGFLYIKLNLIYLNPLWAIFDYVSYRVNDNLILITNYNLSELRAKVQINDEIHGFYIADGIFISKK